MKYRDLVKKLAQAGYRLDRSSGRHDIYVRENGFIAVVPHHKEINELTAKNILKSAGIFN